VDPLSYVRDSAGRVAHDPQRDRQYTRELGVLIAAAYRRDTVLLSTHLVARALFDGVARAAGLADIYALLRVPRARLRLPIGEVAAAVARLRDGIAGCPSAGRVHERVAAMAPVEVVADGLRVFAMVPSGTVAHREGDDVCVDRMRLLYYYRNRTAHFEGG